MRARTGLIAALALCTIALAGAGCAGPGDAHRHERVVFAPDARAPVGSASLAAAPFDEALLSWDVRLDDGVGARLEARVRQDGRWSRWMTVAARGGGDVFDAGPLRRDGAAWVDIDVVMCDTPCDAIEWRVEAAGPGGGIGGAAVRSVWLTATGVGAAGPYEPEPDPPAFAHEVPHKAQRDGGEELAGRLCSPTAVAMVLAAAGLEVGVVEMAALVHDAEFDIYGNWVNNTLAASELGVPMHVTRIGSWAEAEAFMRRGPIVISLPPFDERELDGAGYSSRSGHLIVLRGFDGRGGVLVRDPAHADPGEAARVYRRDQLTRLWLLRNKGTAYVPAAE